MNMSDVVSVALKSVHGLLDTHLLELSGTTITVGTALSAVVVVLVTLRLSKWSRAALVRVMAHRGVADERSTGTLSTLLHYAILFSGFGVALDTVGIDLAALFAAGAIFAIGLGFAMQNIAQNFVSGVILLVEQAIKPGDVIETEGTVCKVVRLGIRATIVQTRDGEDIIVPNSTLAQASVKNFTLEHSVYRLRATVGVHYESDMLRVRRVLQSVVEGFRPDDQRQPPQVLLLEFGDSSVVWEAAVWVTDPWRARMLRSELYEEVWRALASQNIVIAYPQIDLNLSRGALEALTGPEFRRPA